MRAIKKIGIVILLAFVVISAIVLLQSNTNAVIEGGHSGGSGANGTWGNIISCIIS